MTLVVLLLLGFGSVLMVSAIEDHSISQTVAEIWTDSLTIGQGAQTQNTSPQLTYTTHGTGPFGQPIVQGVGVQSPTMGTPHFIYGSAAGPAQQDAYRQAVVRAYLQSRR